jgi:hypothetical protein
MQVVLSAQAEIEGRIQKFEIRQHAWSSELIIEAYGLDAFPVFTSVLDWRVGNGRLSILHEEGEQKVWTVLEKYRPVIRL